MNEGVEQGFVKRRIEWMFHCSLVRVWKMSTVFEYQRITLTFTLLCQDSCRDVLSCFQLSLPYTSKYSFSWSCLSQQSRPWCSRFLVLNHQSVDAGLTTFEPALAPAQNPEPALCWTKKNVYIYNLNHATDLKKPASRVAVILHTCRHLQQSAAQIY